ncbi:MAG: hypothetical protein Ta2F_13950 [Termitinemataceae bacterium]|nr:MAG: hypothetical protein Ta2F_13950 [Termitinemataceae bacterium]
MLATESTSGIKIIAEGVIECSTSSGITAGSTPFAGSVLQMTYATSNETTLAQGSAEADSEDFTVTQGTSDNATIVIGKSKWVTSGSAAAADGIVGTAADAGTAGTLEAGTATAVYISGAALTAGWAE